MNVSTELIEIWNDTRKLGNSPKLCCHSPTQVEHVKVDGWTTTVRKWIKTGKWELTTKAERSTSNYLKYLPPIVWKIFLQLSERSSSNYLKDLPPNIWKIYHQLSERSTSNYLINLPPIIWKINPHLYTRSRTRFDYNWYFKVDLSLAKYSWWILIWKAPLTIPDYILSIFNLVVFSLKISLSIK